jgi:hypothetical protein
MTNRFENLILLDPMLQTAFDTLLHRTLRAQT